MDSADFMFVNTGSPTFEGPSRFFEYAVDYEVTVTIGGGETKTAATQDVTNTSDESDALAGPGTPEAAPQPSGAARALDRLADVFRTKVPTTRTDLVPEGRISLWLPEELAAPGHRTDDVEISVSGDTKAFRLPASEREKLQPEDILLSLASPPEVDRELAAMLGKKVGLSAEDRELIIDRVTAPAQLLQLFQRGEEGGSVQAEVAVVKGTLGDRQVVVRIRAELQAPGTEIPGVVRAGRLAFSENTAVLTSAAKKSSGHSADASLNLGAKAGDNGTAVPAIGANYGKSKAAKTGQQDRSTTGSIESSAQSDHTRRFADVVYSLEIEYQQHTVFGSGRPEFQPVRRIHVPDGLEFLRRVPKPTTARPSGVPETLDSRQALTSGVPRFLQFPETTSDHASGHNPLVDAVIELLSEKEPKLRKLLTTPPPLLR
ncbi:hypothetical protein ACFXKJ_41575, partial [Kitasatospora indigofera]